MKKLLGPKVIIPLLAVACTAAAVVAESAWLCGLACPLAIISFVMWQEERRDYES